MDDYEVLKDRQLRLLRPSPVYLLVAGNLETGDVNVMAESWVTPVSRIPTRLGIVVEKSNYTYGLLKKYPWFTLAVPSMEQAQLIKYVGTWTRREVDKVKKTGIELLPWMKDPRIPVPKGFLGVIIARTESTIDLGPSEFFVGRIVDAYVKKGAYHPSKGWILDYARPLLHKAKHSFVEPCNETVVIKTPWGVPVKKAWREKYSLEVD